ncbi:MAG: dihydroorotase family protein [Candidatus Micrarchaeota archaeon]|nr:dihydroorotase family protein [Candidatus Micrarchaeota archaeon]
MILISGGKIVTPEGVSQSDILIDEKSGKIAKVGVALAQSKAKKIDARGLFILPGAIDGHVHFRDPEPCYRNPATTTLATYNSKLKLAKKRCRCDYQLRFGATNSNFRAAAKSKAPSLKIFLTKTNSELYCTRASAARHFRSFPKNQPICVHAEDESRLASRSAKYSEHGKIHDKLAAQIACEFVLSQAAKTGRRVHLCHLTTAKEVDMCREHSNATYEINPAHLYLSIDDLSKLGFLGKMNPPLRDKQEQKRLWRKIGEDTIIASDHAPHLVPHKRAGAPGLPGVGTLLPLMLQAAHARKITLSSVARMCSCNPAAAFQLPGKGEIKKGNDADLVLVDMNKKWKISAKNRQSKCNWTPFEGMEVYGKIAAVYLRGKLAYDGQKVLSKPGNGCEVKAHSD